MTNKYLGFLYNVRHDYPDPNDPKTFLEADFDDPDTIKYFLKHLQSCGYNVLPIEANLESYEILRKNKNEIFLAFNYSEVVVGEKQHLQITRYLEEFGIFHTGAGDFDQMVIRNKVEAKKVMAENNIPVLPDQAFKTGKERLNDNLKFPLIVKPSSQGSSAGITNKSIVNNSNELYDQVNENISRFNDCVIVEPFLEGREFSIPLLGNKPEILPIIEPNFNNLPEGYNHIDSFEVKWIYEEDKAGSGHLMCPAKIDMNLKNKLDEIALKVWKALKIKDYCRMDIRCNRDEQPYVLEVNSPAGLIPPEVSMTSYLPLSARVMGLSFKELLQKIINSALERNTILV